MKAAQEIFLSSGGGHEGWEAVVQYSKASDRNPLFYRILQETLERTYLSSGFTVERVLELGWPPKTDEL